MVTDMASGMTWCLDDIDGGVAELEGVAVAEGAVEARNGDGLNNWAEDLEAELFLQRQIGMVMVGVVMGGKDMGYRPAATFGRRQNRGRLGCVDRCRIAGFGVMDQDAKIIRAADKYL